MYIKITEEEVEQAKKDMAVFDRVKTYDKFKCKNNYIGLLGEMVLNRWMTEQEIEYEWIDFMKDRKVYKGNIFKYPDFVIWTRSMGKSTIDLKTTTSKKMWFQTPIHDIYIYAKIDALNKGLDVIAYATKEELLYFIEVGIAEEVRRGNRVDYVIDPQLMTQMEELEWIKQRV